MPFRKSRFYGEDLFNRKYKMAAVSNKKLAAIFTLLLKKIKK